MAKLEPKALHFAQVNASTWLHDSAVADLNALDLYYTHKDGFKRLFIANCKKTLS